MYVVKWKCTSEGGFCKQRNFIIFIQQNFNISNFLHRGGRSDGVGVTDSFKRYKNLKRVSLVAVAGRLPRLLNVYLCCINEYSIITWRWHKENVGIGPAFIWIYNTCWLVPHTATRGIDIFPISQWQLMKVGNMTSSSDNSAKRWQLLELISRNSKSQEGLEMLNDTFMLLNFNIEVHLHLKNSNGAQLMKKMCFYPPTPGIHI